MNSRTERIGFKEETRTSFDEALWYGKRRVKFLNRHNKKNFSSTRVTQSDAIATRFQVAL